MSEDNSYVEDKYVEEDIIDNEIKIGESCKLDDGVVHHNDHKKLKLEVKDYVKSKEQKHNYV